MVEIGLMKIQNESYEIVKSTQILYILNIQNFLW